jgi:hypothetical protein
MALLASHGESEVHRIVGAGRVEQVKTAATEFSGGT